MIHKVLPHGSAGEPFDYLLKKDRAVLAKVLAGDVATCLATIRSISFRQKYTSVVLSFAETLTRKRQLAIIADYERVAFSGRADEFSRVWVEHSEHGRTELHLIVANVHLPTGKRWSHYYDRADRKLFKAWQELTNIHYGLGSPDAPERQRLADMPGKLPQKKRKVFEHLDTQVCEGVANGKIRTRRDVVECLESAGCEVEPSKNFIAVKSAIFEGKSLRMRGKKYKAKFDRDALLASALPRTAEQEAARKSAYESNFAEAMVKRTAFLDRLCHPRKRGQATPSMTPTATPAIAVSTPAMAPPGMPQANPNDTHNSYNEDLNGPGTGTDLSTRLRQVDAAGGRAVLAARSAAWGARLAAACNRITGLIESLKARHAHSGGGPLGMGLRSLLNQPLQLGRQMLAGIFAQFERGEESGIQSSRGSSGEPEPTLGETRGQHREWHGPSDLSM
jgi:hypothetical protein